jgi:hypothetical protein
MKVVGQDTSPDWSRLGPTLLTATAMVVAIRTARWPGRGSDALCSDIDHDLDREVEMAARITDRVLHALLRKHAGMFPQKRTPVVDTTEESPP